jgi:hypothetical protein
VEKAIPSQRTRLSHILSRDNPRYQPPWQMFPLGVVLTAIMMAWLKDFRVLGAATLLLVGAGIWPFLMRNFDSSSAQTELAESEAARRSLASRAKEIEIKICTLYGCKPASR